jgi:hypothetical protein
MYAALWRRIPGGLPGKIAGMAGLAVAALALLFFVVFPFVERVLPWNNVTVDSPALTTPAATSTSEPAATTGPGTRP